MQCTNKNKFVQVFEVLNAQSEKSALTG